MKIVVAILNYNGKHWLGKFLPSVILHSPEAEVIVIDNASTDDSLDYLSNNHASIRIVQNEINTGFAGGYNKGLQQIEADIFILLNSDIEVTSNWITPVIEAMENDVSIAAAQPKIKSFDNRNYFEHAGAAGGCIDKNGYPFCRGRVFDEIEEDKGQYDTQEELFWASGACLFIRSKDFWNAGGFDEDFFAHMEEIDLCWRLHHLGRKIVCIPESEVFHVGGGTLEYMNPKKTYLNFRNSLYAIHKNYRNGLFIMIVTRLLLDGVAAFKFLVSGDFKHFVAVLKAHFSYYRQLPQLKKKRKAIVRKHELKQLPGVYRKSILWTFFAKKVKRFNQLTF